MSVSGREDEALTKDALTLTDLLGWLTARWAPLLVITVLVAAVVVALTLNAPPTYTAKAVVRIDRSTYSLYPTPDEALNYVLSDGFQRQVGAALPAASATAVPAAQASRARVLPRLVSTATGWPTSLMELTAQAPDPDEALALARAAASAFVDGTRVRVPESSHRYATHVQRLQDRIDTRKRDLAAARAALAAASRAGRSTAELLLADSRLGRIEQEVLLLEDRLLDARVAFEDACARVTAEESRRSRVVSVDERASSTGPSTPIGVVRAAILGLVGGLAAAVAVVAGPDIWRWLFSG